MSKKTFFSVLKKHGREAPYSHMSVKSELPIFLRDHYNRAERAAARVRAEFAGTKTRTIYNARDLAVDLQIGKTGTEGKVEYSTIASSKKQDGLADIPDIMEGGEPEEKSMALIRKATSDFLNKE